MGCIGIVLAFLVKKLIWFVLLALVYLIISALIGG